MTGVAQGKGAISRKGGAIPHIRRHSRKTSPKNFYSNQSFQSELLRRLPFREQSALSYLITVLRYVTETNRKLTPEEFIILQEHLPPETGVTMETMAEGWFNDGLRKGRREGRQEGRQEGLEEGRQIAGLELTLRQLQHRIGKINVRTQERLRQLSFEQ